MNLPGDHAAHRAGGVRQFRHQRGRARAGEHFKRIRKQRVAGQNGHRLAKYFVRRGAPAAQVIVVERGQIVVD